MLDSLGALELAVMTHDRAKSMKQAP